MSGDLNRANEAVQLAKNLDSLLNDIGELEASIEAATSALEDLRNNKEPDSSKLKSLDLGSATGFVLRMRLQGLLQVQQDKLRELQAALRRDVEILRKISVCPYCKGSGEILSHSYDRFERAIHTRIKAQRCEYCKGTGEIKLGDEVTKIIETIKNRLEWKTLE